MKVSGQIVIALGLCEALAAGANLLFLPSLPILAAALGEPPSRVLATASVYLLLFGAGLLASGPAVDRWGPVRVLYLGLALALAAGVLGWVGGKLPAYVVARALHGLSAGIVLVAARAQLLQIRSEAGAAVALARLSSITLVVTGTAASLSGLVVRHWKWMGGFWVLAAGSVSLALLMRGLRAKRTAGASAPPEVAATPGAFPARQFVVMAIVNSLLYSSYQVFVATAPLVAVNGLAYDINVVAAGSVSLLAAYFLGTLCLASGSVTPTDARVLKLPIVLQLCTGLGLAVLNVRGLTHPALAYGAAALISACHGVLLPCLYARAVPQASKNNGMASGLFYFLPLATSAAVVHLMRFAPINSWITSALTLALAAAISLAMLQLPQAHERREVLPGE